MRKRSPGGASLSPREIPAESKENGSLAEVRGIEQEAAALPKCEESNRAAHRHCKTRKDTLCRHNNYHSDIPCGG